MFLLSLILLAAIFNDCKCHRIVGGVSVSIDDIPYQIAIILRSTNEVNCGGSIITEKHVISAAHCFERYTKDDVFVRAGSTFANEKGSDFDVIAVHNHPDYGKRVRLDNDISILITNGRFKFGSGIQPIRLPQRSDHLSNGNLLNVTGWGFQSSIPGLTKDRKEDHLQLVTVPVFDYDTCKQNYYKDGHIVVDSMFCAGFPEGVRDSCQGDSGGPAAANGILYGIVSWGTGCAQENRPGVYSDVTKLLDFIEDTVKKTF